MSPWRMRELEAARLLLEKFKPWRGEIQNEVEDPPSLPPTDRLLVWQAG